MGLFPARRRFHKEIMFRFVMISLLVAFWYGGWLWYFEGVLRRIILEGGWYKEFWEPVEEIWKAYLITWEYMEITRAWMAKEGGFDLLGMAMYGYLTDGVISVPF